MAYELKDGQGSLFVNDKKGNDKAPDRRGEINIGGTIYKLAGWIKQGANGPWMSMKAEVKEDAPAKPELRNLNPDSDEAVPF